MKQFILNDSYELFHIERFIWIVSYWTIHIKQFIWNNAYGTIHTKQFIWNSRASHVHRRQARGRNWAPIVENLTSGLQNHSDLFSVVPLCPAGLQMFSGRVTFSMAESKKKGGSPHTQKTESFEGPAALNDLLSREELVKRNQKQPV